MAKTAKLPPRDIADRIKIAMESAPPQHLDRIEVAGPGFLNLFLSPSWLHDVLREVVAGDDTYGREDTLQGRGINLEFVSANPTGPLQAGSGRGVGRGRPVAHVVAGRGAGVE